MAAAPVIISVRDVVNRFGTQTVHDGVSFDVRAGEVFGIVGGSGSGKSVLLKTMLGLRRPDAGVVEVEGRDITRMSETELRDVKRRYGVTFQHGALFTSLTVAENIILPLVESLRLDEATLQSLAALRLRMVGLPLEAGAKFPSQLSGGMIKRAALARALALDPRILFLDEPTSDLDPATASGIDALIAKLSRGLGVTVVVVTHDVTTLFTICHRIAILADRKLTVDTLPNLMRSKTPWIHEFLHGPRARGALTAREQHHGNR
jgi:phospholipid/cholesterol/gamma-HCH transport system ATP-binding protein